MTTESSRDWRIWAAFAAVPFADTLAAFVGFPLVWYIGGHAGQAADPTQAARAFALTSGMLAVAVTLGGAVPAFFWLVKRGTVSLWHLIAVGLVLGNAPFAVVVFGFVLPTTVIRSIDGTMSDYVLNASALIAGTLRALLVGCLMGAWSAIVFWFFGVRGRTVHRP
jgi:hypothetical protein